MGHSQSSAFPLHAALTNSAGIKGAIFLETTDAHAMHAVYGPANREAGDLANNVHVW